MKILIATSFAMDVGGVTSHIQTLERALRQKGHETRVVSARRATLLEKIALTVQNGGDPDKARIGVSERAVQRAVEPIRRCLVSGGADLLHVHDVRMAAGCLSLNAGLPLVLTVHGPLSREAAMMGLGEGRYYEYLKQKEKFVYESVDSIIAVDTLQKRIIVEDYRIDPDKIHVIFNAVDTDLFRPRQPDAEREARPFLLVPRRLVPKNGVHVAIEAMRRLSDLDLELWIAGDGPERRKLERMRQDFGLTDRIKFLGAVGTPEMIALMNRSAAVVVPSVPASGVVEASSIAALEAMSAAKVVFASDLGGMAEMIEDGATGVLFSPGDAEHLASRVRAYWHHPEKMKEIGERARRYVVEHHSLEVWVRRILEVYEGVLHR